MKYVLGFLFSEALTRVVLIKKIKPEWQAGKLNGVGGKIEDGESPARAMEREFMEETGIHIRASEWIPVAQMVFDGPEESELHIFTAKGDWLSMAPRRDLPEKAHWIFWDGDTDRKIIPNLRWLIPLCRTFLRPNERESFRLVTDKL